MAHRNLRGLRGAVKNFVEQRRTNPRIQNFQYCTGNYASEMRKRAFEGNILRLIRNEIQYEADHSTSFQPPQELDSFKVDEMPGEQWIRLSRKFGENEDIKIEATMFDRSIPVKKTDDSLDPKLHLNLVIHIIKQECNQVLEFVCSAWPDSIHIRRVYARGRDPAKDQPFFGPEFKELDDELQDSLYDFLESRGIDEELAGFLHSFMRYKDKAEYIRWMGTLKSFIQQ
ncbi:hypothetical protein M569_02113 [Genlisea aurea]|uniref:Mitochondrial glycoprotein family protein n=1 Tax=Genlisea aurea TaxID=192259 RepID=S8CYV5_9LAMI|nr:hypothetical protein M569_02113 [Genlisea aurea]